MTSANDDRKQAANPQERLDRQDQPSDRKLTVIGHHTTTPTPPQTESGEVIRDLVVPRPPDDAAKLDELRSPGSRDRDVMIPPPVPKETEAIEVMREMIVPRDQAKPDPKDADF